MFLKLKAFLLFLLLSNILLANLSKPMLSELKMRIALLESKGLGDTLAENRFGYLGRYQFGAIALVDVGLMKRSHYLQATHIDPKTKKRGWKKGQNNKVFINNSSNWKISNGKKSFLGNETLQENVMDILLKKNYFALKKTRIKIHRKDRIMGFLMAAHLGGFSSALRYLKSKKEYTDAMGTKISTYFNAAKQNLTNIRKKQNSIIAIGKKYLGGKYIWGGTNPSGFDCSGYIQYIFNKQGIKLPRTAYAQSKKGKEVTLNHIKKGDLLFFNTDKSRGIPVTHVGVYLEEGKFIHAANQKNGIVISTLDSYKNRFVTAKRVIDDIDLASSPKSVRSMVTYPRVIGTEFFQTHLERAIKSETKVSLNIVSNEYKYVNGRYKKVQRNKVVKLNKKELQLW